MLSRLSAAYAVAAVLAQSVAMVILLCLLSACGGGASPQTTVVTPVKPPPVNEGTSPASSFGMQCGSDVPAGNQIDCYSATLSPPIQWPQTQAQPGCIRLHDTGTYWAQLNPSSGVYDWTRLDNWLDVIAQNEPRCAIQTFTWVPCWDSTTSLGTCGISPDAPTGTNGFPTDLTPAPTGSPTFNSFVTAFVQHCSPAGNCVSDIIKYYDMWNEWDLNYHWVGTMQQVYDMVAPATAIIKTNVPNAVIMMPSATPAAVGAASNTGLGYQQDFQNWLNYENQNGRISDWVNWHSYLSATDTTTNTPEAQFATYIKNGSNGFLDIQAATSGWASVPFANTETNFNGSAQVNFTCPAPYTATDCTGQIVRWQLLFASNGSSSLDWYKWLQTIGSNPAYETAYYDMMQYMVGGKFAAPCSFTSSGGIETWTCNFTESSANGSKQALFVWSCNESSPGVCGPTATGTTFTVPTGYTDYQDFNGDPSTSISSGQTINIGAEPLMLEQ